MCGEYFVCAHYFFLLTITSFSRICIYSHQSGSFSLSTLQMSCVTPLPVLTSCRGRRHELGAPILWTQAKPFLSHQGVKRKICGNNIQFVVSLREAVTAVTPSTKKSGSHPRCVWQEQGQTDRRGGSEKKVPGQRPPVCSRFYCLPSPHWNRRDRCHLLIFFSSEETDVEKGPMSGKPVIAMQKHTKSLWESPCPASLPELTGAPWAALGSQGSACTWLFPGRWSVFGHVHENPSNAVFLAGITILLSRAINSSYTSRSPVNDQGTKEKNKDSLSSSKEKKRKIKKKRSVFYI